MRRRLLVIGIALGIVCAMAGGLWVGWLPHYRPALSAGERYGIDVSHFQGVIDWNRVAEDDISFVYIKASEGGTFVDARFATNWAGAGAADLDRGAYHFFTLCTPGDVQARHFLSVLPKDPSSLPPALDLELPGNCEARPDAADVQTQVRSFVRTVEAATSKKIVLYIGGSFEAAYGIGGKFDEPRWTPRFLMHPAGSWTVWQVGGFATIDGIAGRVDLDVDRN
jgi:lysozyme